MRDLDLVFDLENEPRLNINMPIKTNYTTFYFMAIEMIPVTFTVCEICRYELQKCTPFESLTKKKKMVKAVRYNAAYIRSLDDNLYGRPLSEK